MASISLPDILRLSVAERLRLVGEIWNSIASEPAVPGDLDDPEGRLARLERHGLLRRASAPLPREVLMADPPQLSEGASILDTLLAERRDDNR